MYIYPENYSYEEKNFKWRISLSTVEIEEPEFTKLPNIQRKTIVLDEELLLSKQNYYDKKLEKFDIDSIDGDWNTINYSKVTYFNLMTSKDCSQEVRHINLKSEINLQLKININNSCYRY